MAPTGSTKRKRNERTNSQDNHPDQPAAKSPRGGRFPNYVQPNQNRDGGYRGGRGGNRGGSRLASNASHASNASTRPHSANTSAPATPTATEPPTPTPEAVPAPSAVEKPLPTARANSPQPQHPTITPPTRYFGTMVDDVVETWQDSGKSSVVELARQARQSQEYIKLNKIFQEIVWSGLDGRIDAAEAGETVRLIISDPAEGDEMLVDEDTGAAFLDVVAIACANEISNLRLRDILLATNISHEDIVLILTDEMLMAQKLVRPTFQKMGIRHQTNVLYRQDNYNLLREESEGYSKLVTELFTTMENEPHTHEVAKASFERVKAMIGSFNLDVGRVLDVTMDVFASVLIRHTRFVVHFLHASTWWPTDIVSGARHPDEVVLDTLPYWIEDVDTLRDSVNADLRYQRDKLFWNRAKEAGLKAYFELGGRRADVSQLNSAIPLLPEVEAKDGSKSKPPISNILRQWIEVTGTLPPTGNVDAAQILGFKLRFYNSSARDASDNLPSNLIYLAALLIKLGFISFIDLYPHLWPSDDDMAAVKKRLEAEKAEKEKDRKPGGRNALELAGALPDDTLPPPRRLPEKAKPLPSQTDKKEANEEVKKLPDPVDQKIQLLKSLLLVGAVPEALFMIGRFPWLNDLLPELPEHINRIIHQSLDLVYGEIRPLQGQDGLQEPKKYADLEATNVPKGFVSQKSNVPRKILRWAQLDKSDGGDGIAYRYYWDDWSNSIPICHSIDDVMVLCDTLVNINGMKIGQDPLLMAKLARLGVHSLKTDTSEANLLRWQNLCKRLLVPATSLSGRNTGTVSEIWSLLKLFKLSVRYNIYFEWYGGATSRNKDITAAFAYTMAETKNFMGKISKDNAKAMSRKLSQIAIASPGKTFGHVIHSLENYDNMIESIVEASQYFTDLTNDVLVWSLVNALGKNRDRKQADGMFENKWLVNLSLFIGRLFWRYKSLNPTPILQHVANQLSKRNSGDLTILAQLIFAMTGILKDANFEDNKVISMCGGPILRDLTLQSMGDERSGKKEIGEKGAVVDKRRGQSTRRLVKALLSNGVLANLMVGIAQERQACVFQFDDADVHLKVMGNFFDQLHKYLIQYLDLIHSNLSQAEFQEAVPALEDLIGAFGIDPAVAFSIWRPFLAAEIAAYDKKIADKATSQASTEVNGVAEAKDKNDMEIVKTTDAQTTRDPATISGKVDVNQDVKQDESGLVDQTTTSNGLDSRAGHPLIQELIQTVASSLPSETFELIGETFYFTFWRLAGSDLHTPETYMEIIKKNTASIESKKRVRGGTTAEMKKRESERLELADQNTKLMAEYSNQLNLYQKTKNALLKEKDTWFVQEARWEELNTAILEHCFIPRIMLSQVDAFYVFKMLKMLHSMGTKNFFTCALLDQFFTAKRLLPLLFSCTEGETHCLGRFILEVFQDLHKWHASKELFEKEAFGPKQDLPGFLLKGIDGERMSHEGFRTIYAKWHRSLHDVLRSCLQSQDYMHVKNACILLNGITSIFPAIEWHGNNILTAVTAVKDDKSRPDLELVAKSLTSKLQRAKSTWVSVQVFSRNKPDSPGASNSKNAAATSTTKNSGTAKAPLAEKSLNAKAAEFVPKALSIDPAKKRDLRGEAEDGEIRTPLTAKGTPTTTLSNGHQHDRGSQSSRQDDRLPPRPSAARTDDRQSTRGQDRLPARPDSRQYDSKTDTTSRNSSSYATRPNDVSRHHSSSHMDSSRMHSTRPEERTSPRDSDYRRSDRQESNRVADATRSGTGRGYERSNQSDRNEPSWGGERDGQTRAYDDGGAGQAYGRDDRYDRPASDTRDRYKDSDKHEARSRDSSKAPRPSTTQSSDRTSLLKTAQEQDRSHHSGHSDRRHDSSRVENNPGSRNARPASPPRRSDHDNHADHRRHDGRSDQDGRRPNDYSLSRHAEPRQAGSRSDYHNDSGHTRTDRSHDDQRGAASSRQDQSNGWSDTRPAPRTQDSNYGRLNQDPPAGPRTNNQSTAPVGPRNTRAASSQQSPTSTQAPAGSLKGAASFQRPNNPAVPSASQPAPETAGIHPDRLKALQANLSDAQKSASAATIQTPPAGPRSAVPESNSARSVSSNQMPPNGARGDKRFSGVNNILSQVNSNSTTDRPSQNMSQRGAGRTSDTSSPATYEAPRQSLDSRNNSFSRPTRIDTQADTRRDYQQSPVQESQANDQRRLMQSGSRDNLRQPNGFRDTRSQGLQQTPPMHQDRRPVPQADRNGRHGGRDDWGRPGPVTAPRNNGPSPDQRKRTRGDGNDYEQPYGNQDKRVRRA